MPLPVRNDDLLGAPPLFKGTGKEDSSGLVLALDREPNFSGLDEEESNRIKIERKDGKIMPSTANILIKDAEAAILDVVKKAYQFAAKHKTFQHREKVFAKLPQPKMA